MYLTRESWKMLKVSRQGFNCVRTMSGGKTLDISGVYPPIVTPFSANENINWDKLKENMGKWNQIPFRGYVVGGSNGENVFLTDQEKLEMVKNVRELTGSDKLIIAGSGCESTRATLQLTKSMAEAGANAALIITPSFYKGKINSEALIDYYTKVADSSPIPVILYSVPANTNVDIPPEVAIKMAEHPNVIGMKDSGGDITKLGLMVHKTRHLDFQILAGSAGHMLAAYMLGCVGGVCALANTLGQQVYDLHSLIDKGEIDKAKELQYRLIAPNTAVTKTFGVAGLKESMEWFGFYGGLPRSPLRPLPKADEEKLKNIFKNEGFLS